MHRVMTLCLLALVSTALIGCGLARSVQFQSDIKQATDACRASMADPALDSIRTKVPLVDIRDVTLAMRTDETAPTPREKAAMVVWDQKRHACQKRAMEIAATAQLPEQVQALYETIIETGNELVAELYTGKITYAGYAKAGSVAFVAAYKSLADVETALASQQEAQRERAALIATQAIANLNSFMQSQRPVTCVSTGALTTCH